VDQTANLSHSQFSSKQKSSRRAVDVADGRCSSMSGLGGESYFAPAMERRLWRILRSFPPRPG
jgi:hypothetical protein